MITYKKLPTKTKVILAIQSVSMLMGTSTHLMWAIKNGFLSEQYHAPLPNMLFWDSLTFLDPLAAVLLFLKPKTGIILTAAIILIDVVHNNLYYFDELYLQEISITDWIQTYWMIFGQILFAIFVLFTFRKNLTEINTIN